MKILHIVYSDLIGGASKAAYLIHKTLLENDIESKMLVYKKISDDGSVYESRHSLILDLFFKLEPFFFKNRNNIKSEFSTNLFSKLKIDWGLIDWADIINIHWIGNSTLSYKKIESFMKPIVWRLPDQFPFTGGCHFSGECTNYEVGCGNCYLLENKINDLSRKLFLRKQKHLSKIKSLTIVSPSSWMDRKVKKSLLFADRESFVINTGIDTSLFSPIGQKSIYPIKNINLLFIASNPVNDPRKGFKYVRELINEKLSEDEKKRFNLVLIGEEEIKNSLDLNIRIKRTGKIEDRAVLREYYSNADIMIAPYVEDNLPNTILEAMACETVVLAFDVGGINEIIDHKIDGFLSSQLNSEHLYSGLNYIIKSDLELLKKNARNKIVNKFNCKKNYKKFFKLYRDII